MPNTSEIAASLDTQFVFDQYHLHTLGFASSCPIGADARLPIEKEAIRMHGYDVNFQTLQDQVYGAIADYFLGQAQECINQYLADRLDSHWGEVQILSVRDRTPDSGLVRAQRFANGYAKTTFGDSWHFATSLSALEEVIDVGQLKMKYDQKKVVMSLAQALDKARITVQGVDDPVLRSALQSRLEENAENFAMDFPEYLGPKGYGDLKGHADPPKVKVPRKQSFGLWMDEIPQNPLRQGRPATKKQRLVDAIAQWTDLYVLRFVRS